MAALPLNTAPHFVFYYRFCNSLDFCCALHPKKNVYHFQGLFEIIKIFFLKFQDYSRTNCTVFEFQEFSRTKVIFQDFSRSVRTLPWQQNPFKKDVYSKSLALSPGRNSLIGTDTHEATLKLILSLKVYQSTLTKIQSDFVLKYFTNLEIRA